MKIDDHRSGHSPNIPVGRCEHCGLESPLPLETERDHSSAPLGYRSEKKSRQSQDECSDGMIPVPPPILPPELILDYCVAGRQSRLNNGGEWDGRLASPISLLDLPDGLPESYDGPFTIRLGNITLELRIKEVCDGKQEGTGEVAPQGADAT